VFWLHFVTMGSDGFFAGATQLLPLSDWPLENLDEDLENCLQRVSFVLPSHFHVIVLALIVTLLQALVLSEKQHE
jgi:hypothetical protein